MGSHVSHRMFLTVDGTEVELTTDAVDVACAFRLFENHDLLLDTRCIDGDAFLLSYESSSRASFKRICHYQRIIRQYIQRDSVPVIIVARDFSSTRKREVSHAEGWALASKEKCIFYVLNMEDASPKVTNEVLVRFIRARWHWDARNSIPRSENNAVQGL